MLPETLEIFATLTVEMQETYQTNILTLVITFPATYDPHDPCYCDDDPSNPPMTLRTLTEAEAETGEKGRRRGGVGRCPGRYEYYRAPKVCRTPTPGTGN